MHHHCKKCADGSKCGFDEGTKGRGLLRIHAVLSSAHRHIERRIRGDSAPSSEDDTSPAQISCLLLVSYEEALEEDSSGKVYFHIDVMVLAIAGKLIAR